MAYEVRNGGVVWGYEENPYIRTSGGSIPLVSPKLLRTFTPPVKMEVRYTGGETYSVSGVKVIKVTSTKGGGHNLYYEHSIDRVVVGKFGRSIVTGQRSVDIMTKDVAEIITTDTSRGYSEVTRHVFAKVGVK